MKRGEIARLCVACTWMVGIARAGLVGFDLYGDPAVYSVLDNQASATVTNGGIAATLSASPNGVLNRTTETFGVNDVTTGGDDSDALDKDEYIDVVFDRDVTFSNLTIASWAAGNAGEVQLDAGSGFVSQGSIPGAGDAAYGFFVPAGRPVRILATAEAASGVDSKGFSVNAFSVETVPEPAAIGLLVFGVAGWWGIKRIFSS